MRRISETTSTYLNVLRFLTATGVVLFHFRDKDFGPAWLTGFFPSQGQSFVVVFFVLSGFFVTMLAEQKSLGEFALDRMIRIYIVALPILLFTSVLSAVAPSISTTDEYEFALQHPAATILRGLFPEGFIRHWFLAGAFAVHIWGVCSIEQNFPATVSRWADELAGMSYSLYLLHMPLLYLLAAIALSDQRSLAFRVIALPAIYFGSYLLSICTEAQRGKVEQ